MRLIDTRSLQITEFKGSDVPPYAILSHRWEKDEVTFDEIVSESSGNVSGMMRHTTRYAKLVNFCFTAQQFQYDYGWLDTCCIDKRNSSELGEAINSMYRWYHDAGLCITYLQDVGPNRKSMKESEWFDRGWTLQELIAPSEICFFDTQWHRIGTKQELLSELAVITGVPKELLNGSVKPHYYSVAQRMSWAAKRVTERVEDRAYSLMGLFNVNMPMIYGERERAFLRLQEEIISRSDDESIFAWSMELDSESPGYCGPFATSPSMFATCGRTISIPGSLGFPLQHGQLSMQLEIRRYSPTADLAFLHCSDDRSPDRRYAIFVSRLLDKNQFVRVIHYAAGSRLLEMPVNCRLQAIRVPLDPVEAPSPVVPGFWLRTLKPPNHHRSEIQILSRVETFESDHVYADLVCLTDTVGIVSVKMDLRFNNFSQQIRWMKFAFDEMGQPVFLIANTLYEQQKRLVEVFSLAGTFNSSTNDRSIFSGKWMEWVGKDRPAEWRGSSRHAGTTDIVIARGNRENGLHCLLHTFNVVVDITLQPYKATTTGADKQNPLATKIWTVDITECQPAPTKQDSRPRDHCACQ